VSLRGRAHARIVGRRTGGGDEGVAEQLTRLTFRACTACCRASTRRASRSGVAFASGEGWLASGPASPTHMRTMLSKASTSPASSSRRSVRVPCVLCQLRSRRLRSSVVACTLPDSRVAAQQPQLRAATAHSIEGRHSTPRVSRSRPHSGVESNAETWTNGHQVDPVLDGYP